MNSQQSEKLFFDKLKDIFVGVKVEGKGGYINLMRIKSQYFDKVFSEIQSVLAEWKMEHPDVFTDGGKEMFSTLNTFFKSYFNESGSIYFTYTPLKSKI